MDECVKWLITAEEWKNEITRTMKMAKTCCCMLAGTLCVAVVLPVAAFDWKAKPIAELKADLVAYARKVD